MHFSHSILALALGTFSTTLAFSPPPSRSHQLVERDNVIITVTICQGENLSGTCMSPSIETQTQCLGYSGSEWDNTMRSINIPSGHRCRFWDSNNCNGDSTSDIPGPGTSNLEDNMKNKATSFKCYVGE